MGIESKEQNTQVEKTPTSYKGIDKRPLKPSVQVDFPEKLEYMSERLSKDFFYKTFIPVLFVGCLLTTFLFYIFGIFNNVDLIKKLEIRYAELSQEYIDSNDFCFAGGKKVRISDTETAELYGEDLFVLPFGGIINNAFCIGKQRATNTAIFIVAGQNPIVEQVTLKKSDRLSIKVIRPNGYNIVDLTKKRK